MRPAALPSSLPRATLEGLLEKYDALMGLRAERDAKPDAAATPALKATLRALALRHPGCLRELDRLPLSALQARRAAVATCLSGGKTPPWLLWIAAYHALLDAGLSHKRRGAPREVPWPPVTEAFLKRALHPPEGRLSRLALAEVARAVGEPVTLVEATLFPPRHRPQP